MALPGPNLGSQLAASSLEAFGVDIFCQEDGLAAAIDKTEVLDYLAITVMQTETFLSADLELRTRLQQRNDFCEHCVARRFELVADQDHRVHILLERRIPACRFAVSKSGTLHALQKRRIAGLFCRRYTELVIAFRGKP